MGQFLAKMEEKATKIKTTMRDIGDVGAAGLKTNKSKDNLTDYELSKLSLAKRTPQVW